MRRKVGIIILLCLLLTSCEKNQKKLTENYIEKINQSIENFNNETISYESAKRMIEEIQSENQDIISKKEEALEEIAKLQDSKEAYKKALSEYEAENYQSAMKYYGEVIESDSKYKAAQNGIVDAGEQYLVSVRELCDTYVQEGKYMKAIQFLEDSKEVYDNGKADMWIEETKDTYRADIESLAAMYEAEEDYIKSIEKYKELYDYFLDEKYQVKILEIENKCVNAAVTESEMFLSELNFSEAKKVLNDAIKTVSDDSELNIQLERVESFEPKNVKDELQEAAGWFDGKAVSINDWMGTDKDNLGNTYSSGWKISGSRFDGAYNAIYRYERCTFVRVFNLDGMYNNLKGKFCIHEDKRDKYSSRQTDDDKAAIFILGDGNLLYSYGVELSGDYDIASVTDGLQGNEAPVSFDINVTGINTIEIHVISFTKCGLVDLTVQKDYVPLGESDVASQDEN